MATPDLTAFLNELAARLREAYVGNRESEPEQAPLFWGGTLEYASRLAARICRRRPGLDSAAIAAASALEVLLHFPDCLNRRVRYTTYLFRVVSANCTDGIRRWRPGRLPLEDADAVASSGPNPEELILRNDHRRAVQVILASLTPMERTLAFQVMGEVPVEVAMREFKLSRAAAYRARMTLIRKLRRLLA
jgi:hypothetical protein